jgi:Mg2+ and Co2+ transporter CorA
MASSEFREENIKLAESIASDIRDAEQKIKNELKDDVSNVNLARMINHVSHFSLNAIAGLYEENAFFMRLFNDIGKIIDKLPEDYSELKINYHGLIKQFEEDHKFVSWEKRLRADEAKDVEK